MAQRRATQVGMQDHPSSIDDWMERRRRPCGEGGFGLIEDQIYRGQLNFRIKFEARADVIQGVAESIQSQRATKMRNESRGRFGLKKLFDGGKITKCGHR